MYTINNVKLNQYVSDVLRTESSKLPLSTDIVKLRLSNRLFHSICGISTEMNELYLAIESAKLDNKELDVVNVFRGNW